MKRYFKLATKELVPIMFEFECKNDFFSNYLKFNSIYDNLVGQGTTHLFIEESEDLHKKVIGFYTLKNTSLSINANDSDDSMGYPAIEICQLATHERYEKQGIGEIMIKDAIAKSFKLNNMLSAVKYIVLCSRKDAVKYYRDRKFKPIENNMSIPREQWNRDCCGLYFSLIADES